MRRADRKNSRLTPAPEPAAPVPSATGLRLRAEDAEDLAIIAACLQDALVSVRDLAYDPVARGFLLVVNRFRWEGTDGGTAAPFERTLCAIAFDAVDHVTYRGFRRSEEERILSLLTIRADPSLGGARIDLEFAGGATIRLLVGAIACRARDVGAPWPTSWQPGHELDELQ